MSYLLDTNIISEIIKPKPNKGVTEFVSNLHDHDFYISVLTLGEIKRGVENSLSQSKKAFLSQWFENNLKREFADRILDIDFNIAEKWGFITANLRNYNEVDSLIAATAISYNLKLVTRNIKDFKIFELEIIDPFK
ncbi:MAG TPA: VapC toxin family PIN domain ribonuclease [Alphaproteobacteria bacterium]|nr:VapC toxin family PIN domain ribonuclease [Alphaproteobacteria bacterium]